MQHRGIKGCTRGHCEAEEIGLGLANLKPIATVSQGRSRATGVVGAKRVCGTTAAAAATTVRGADTLRVGDRRLNIRASHLGSPVVSARCTATAMGVNANGVA